MLAGKARQPRNQARRPVRFTFAVLSDTHDHRRCRAGQGRWVRKAIELVEVLTPDFVVGLGDLIAGGGDCRYHPRQPWRSDAWQQLDDLRRELLEPLRVPFVPVAGNHDLKPISSVDRHAPKRAWRRFWRRNNRHLLHALQGRDFTRHQRITYQGHGLVFLAYPGRDGLSRHELRWVRRHVRAGDLVFRHINPFGVSCLRPGHCGIALGSHQLRDYEALARTLRDRGVSALFSGHTHAFYDGICDGLRFINTGSLGARSMEYLQGWQDSPHAKKQAFVLATVYENGALGTTFFVWSQSCDCFTRFDPQAFPRVVRAQRRRRGSYDEGVEAACVSVLGS